MKKKIIILPGDGIGKEVTAEGRRVLVEVASAFGHTFDFESATIGHDAIVAEGTALPDATLHKLRTADAILFGAVGHPAYDKDPTLKVRPEQGLLRMRKELGLYANLRPIKIFDELLNASSIKPEVLKGSDILFFRELTGDVYFGEKGRKDDGDTAFDLMIYQKYEIERIAHKAFAAARTRKRKVTSVDKANVLESSRLWRTVVQEVSKQYPEVVLEHEFVDAMAMKLIQQPRHFDVVLTGNLFGDILTDEASQIAGSMGMLASASIGDQVGLYEPIHGSAHDLTGKGIANPLASILSAALMLDISFGLTAEAEAVVAAVQGTLRKGFRTADIAADDTPKEKILDTKSMGSRVVEELVRQPVHHETI